MNKYASDSTAIPTDQTAARSPASPSTPWKAGVHPAALRDLVNDCRRRRVVPLGRLPEHEAQTGTGLILLATPRARDRTSAAPVRPIQFRFSPLPGALAGTPPAPARPEGVSAGAAEEAPWACTRSEAPSSLGGTIQCGTAGWERAASTGPAATRPEGGRSASGLKG